MAYLWPLRQTSRGSLGSASVSGLAWMLFNGHPAAVPSATGEQNREGRESVMSVPHKRLSPLRSCPLQLVVVRC